MCAVGCHHPGRDVSPSIGMLASVEEAGAHHCPRLPLMGTSTGRLGMAVP